LPIWIRSHSGSQCIKRYLRNEPITAMNIVCFPADVWPEAVLRDTLAEGLDVLHEAGAILVGGHNAYVAIDAPGIRNSGGMRCIRIC